MSAPFSVLANKTQPPQDITARPRGRGKTPLDEALDRLKGETSATHEGSAALAGGAVSLAEQLYDALASAKVQTSKVSMHLDGDWRNKLFGQLDSLLSMEDWDREDLPLQARSYQTFLRTILFIGPSRRPGLGLTGNGNLVAAWTTGANRLTLEFEPGDRIRWSLTREANGGKERAVGESSAERIAAVLAPYEPEVWFGQ